MSPLRAGALAVALLSFPTAATGQSEPEQLAVSISVDECVEVDAAEVHRLFGIELGTSVPEAVQIDDPDDPEATQVQVLCDGELVSLRVQDPVTGKSLMRRIALGDKGRERLLSLAVMELLVASWIELEATPDPKVKPVDRRAKENARRSARRIAKQRLPPKNGRWRTTTSVLGAVSLASPGMHGGGGVRVELDGPNGYGWGADIVVQRTTHELELGDVSVSSIGGGLSVHAHRTWGAFRLRGALGARVGAVSMSGEPTDPDVADGGSFTARFAGPFARLTVGVEAARRVTVQLSAEPGYHLLPVRGTVNKVDTTKVEGPWLAGTIALGVRW